MLRLILMVMFLTSCAAQNVRPNDELIEDSLAQTEYYIKPGDLLRINVWGEPKLSGEVVVRSDGKITVALADDIQAQGKTLTQLKDDIEAKLNEFIPGVSVSPSMIQSAPIRYFLAGQFLRPGEFRSDQGITLLQAVAKAGGFAPFANENSIILIRKNSANELRYQLNYNNVVNGKQPNPKLADGDFISVE